MLVFWKAPAKAIKPLNQKNEFYLQSVHTKDWLSAAATWEGSRALKKQLDQNILHLQLPFFSNVAVHQCENL